MILNTIPSKRLLYLNGYDVGFRDILIARGLSIFAKYIPGKIMNILGPTEYYYENCSTPRKTGIAINLQEQFTTLLTGIAIGIIGLLISGNFLKQKLNYGLIVIFFLLTAVVFSPIIRIAIEYFFTLFKKKIELPEFNSKRIIQTLPYFILSWIFYCIAFSFFVNALIEYDIQYKFLIGTIFATGGTLGVLALFAPGGIGVREGLLVGYMIMWGISETDATTIAVSSRLWFLIGECFIFLVGLFLNKKK